MWPERMEGRTTILGVVLVVAVLAFAGCGGGDDTTTLDQARALAEGNTSTLVLTVCFDRPPQGCPRADGMFFIETPDGCYGEQWDKAIDGEPRIVPVACASVPPELLEVPSP